MQKFKILYSFNSDELTEIIEKFANFHEIIEIDYAVSSGENDRFFSVLIMYKS